MLGPGFCDTLGTCRMLKGLASRTGPLDFIRFLYTQEKLLGNMEPRLFEVDTSVIAGTITNAHIDKMLTTCSLPNPW